MNNCDWKITCALSMSPDQVALQKLPRFLLAMFAVTDEGFKLLLALLAFVAKGEVMPYIMLLIIRTGGEGKTLFALQLVKSVLGSGHAECPGTMLQHERGL